MPLGKIGRAGDEPATWITDQAAQNAKTRDGREALETRAGPEAFRRSSAGGSLVSEVDALSA